MTGLSVEFLGWPPLAALAASFAAAWLALRLRRAERQALPRRSSLVLAILRVAAIALLATALAEPALAWSDTRREAPAVAVVIDRSGSMGLADPGLDPGARLAEAVALGLIERKQRPDAAARAGALARRAAAGGTIQAAEATALAGEVAGSPELAAALNRLALALSGGTPTQVREAAGFSALADRLQGEADAALVAGAAADSAMGVALARIGAQPRRDRAAAMAARLVKRLPQAVVDWFVLDERLVPVSPESLHDALAGEAGTDLGEGLASLARGWAGRGHPAGCILLSDGRRTAGADPEPAARALAARGVRLLAVAIGDPTPPLDVAVASLEAPGEAVAGERVHLTASVRVPPGAGSWELAWLRDGAEVARQAVAPDTAWQRLSAGFPAGDAGVALWEARLTPAPGEERGLGWLREVWTGLARPGLDALLADPRWPAHPDERAVVAASLSIDPRPLRGDRLRAWLLPPRDGEYVLWLSSDDVGELLIAEDGDAGAARPVARVTSWTPPEDWEKEPGQRSVPVKLRADRPAYIEARVVNETGPSHIAVGWTRPDGKVERPLPLTVLVPWTAAGPPARGGARRETTVANNAAARAVAIAAAPPRVLAIDAGPRWEMRHAVAALETALGARVERRYRAVLGPGVALVPEQSELDQVDMLLLGDLPPAELGADEQSRIAAFATRRGGFVAVVSGPRAMPAAYGLGPLAALLPVRSAAAESLPEPDAAVGAGASAERILPGLAPGWEALPVLPWWVHSAVPRPGAEVVLGVHDRSGSPLLVCSDMGAGRVAWLGSDQLWRWRAHGDGSVHAAMWLRLARWGMGARLSGTDRRLQAALDLSVAAPGQPAGLRLRALDAAGAPGPAPAVVLERIGVDGRPIPGSRRELALAAIADQPGTWSTMVNVSQRPLEEGRWRLRAGSEPGPVESRELLIRLDPGREALEPALDRAELDRLAAATGGEAVGLDGIDGAIDALAATLHARTLEVRHRLTLWDGPWWLLALAAVLCAEWAWRRRLGLP